jgi:hypothetical protein
MFGLKGPKTCKKLSFFSKCTLGFFIKNIFIPCYNALPSSRKPEKILKQNLRRVIFILVAILDFTLDGHILSTN